MRPTSLHHARPLAAALLALAALLLCAPAPACALGPEPGEEAPELLVKEWVNGKGVDPSKNRDTILVVLFFQTTATDMLKYIKPYCDWAEKYKDQGLLVEAVSRESKDLLFNWVDENSIKFPVGVDNGSWKGNWGVEGYPAAFVVDIYGEIAWKGDGNQTKQVDAAIQDALKMIKRINVKRAETGKGLEKVWRSIDKGDYTQAIKFIDPIIASGKDEVEKAFAAGIKKDIETMATAHFERTKELEKRFDYYGAETILKELEKSYQGTEASKSAKARLVEYGKDETIKEELFSQKCYEQGRKLEESKKYKEAAECYRASMSKGSTHAARKSMARMAELTKKGFVH